jgi:hypothetical protein
MGTVSRRRQLIYQCVCVNKSIDRALSHLYSLERIAEGMNPTVSDHMTQLVKMGLVWQETIDKVKNAL